MSDIIKLKIGKGNIKARLPSVDDLQGYNESEDSDNNFKRELENQYQTGFNDGYATAQSEYEMRNAEEITAKTQEFYNILSSFDEKLLEIENSFTKIVMELSHLIAEKIINREVDYRNIISNTISESVKKILGANDVTIKLNPRDLEKITEEGSGSALNRNFSRIKFEENDNIQQGGCLIETEIGNVDARVSTQISEIIKQIELDLSEQE